MKSTVLLLLFTLYLNHQSFGQKITSIPDGTVKTGEHRAMKAAEVNIKEWIIFILNNHYDSTLYPNLNLLSKQAQLLFLDLKKEKDFEYLKISKMLDHDLGEIETVAETSRFTNLCEKDSIDFSIISTPITGITYAQANRYCAWLETLVTKHRQIDITISLPTDWMYKYVNPNLDSLNRKGCALFNFIHCNCISQTKKDYNQILGKRLVVADAYFPTDFGIYNLQGNAAEMTNIEGIAMGGSFKHYAKESYSNQVQHYIGAEEWLGFRYMVTYN